MSTFNYTIYKGTDHEKSFNVDLGRDVIEGMSQHDLEVSARKSEHIKLQIPCRKHDDPAKATAEMVKRGYPDAVITEGAVIEVSEAAIVRKAAKGLSAMFDGDTDKMLDMIKKFKESSSDQS